MNYDEYYIKCIEEYGKHTTLKDSVLYSETIKIFNSSDFSKEYSKACNSLSIKVGHDFDNLLDSKTDGIMVTHDNIWKYLEELQILSREIVPYLEENTFGCYLYVDKVYIYRTLKRSSRESSYLWHHDNNPNELVKNLIYLDDVGEENSPFEFIQNEHGFGTLGHCTRRGAKDWYPAPNNSRHSEQDIQNMIRYNNCSKRKVLGKKGTMISFNNNIIHRANPVINGKRDVINIRVKPTMKKSPEYISPLWTTSYETSGAVNPNPQIDWFRKSTIN